MPASSRLEPMLCDYGWDPVLVFFCLCFSQKFCCFFIHSIKQFSLPVCALVENPLSSREYFLFPKALYKLVGPPHLRVSQAHLVLFISYVILSLKVKVFLKTLIRILVTPPSPKSPRMRLPKGQTDPSMKHSS